MTGLRRAFLIAAALVPTALAACLLAERLPAASAEDAAATTRPNKGGLPRQIVAIGAVRSEVGAEVKVGSQISGVVRKLNVSVGDIVAKGALLATLDDRNFEARLDQAKADQQTAGAELVYAEQELAEVEVLEKLEKRRPEVTALTLESARRNVAIRRSAVALYKARVAEALLQVEFTRISAPISGTVASVSTYEGETVAASLAAPTFVTIVDLSRLEVQAYVDETDIGNIREGQRATFRVDAYPGKEFEGTVHAIYPKAQIVNNVVDYVVIIKFNNTSTLIIRPDMTTHVNFVVDSSKSALTVPRSAVLNEDGHTYVVVRSSKGWQERAVTVGQRSAQQVEIVGGLDGSEIMMLDARGWQAMQKRTAP